MNPTAPLGRVAAGGALHTGGSQALRAILSIATTIVVARILSPGDYGVVAMVAPVLAFVLLLQDLGFSAATVQAKEISAEQSSTLFWTNVGASTLIAVLLVLVSPLIGSFYADARVGHVTAASAIAILLISVALQHNALLNREMRFREIARITVASAVTTCLATIGLALFLQSYWALFLGGLAGIFTQVVMAWRIQAWRPSRRISFRATRSLLGFGGYVAAFDLLNFLSRNADSVLIGRFWGAGPLGLYERSQKLMLTPLQLVNAPLARVMLPVLSRLRDEPERYRMSYLYSLRSLLLATTPAAAVAVATSDLLVPLLLGPQWQGASPIFFWLAIATLYQPLANSMGWLFLSSGRARAFAGWGLFSSAITLISFVIGLPWGPAGVAMAYVIGGILRLPILLQWAPWNTPVRTIDIYAVSSPFIVAAGATWWVLAMLGDFLAPLFLIAAGTLLSYLLAIIALCSTSDGREFLRSSFDLLKSLSPRKV